MYGLVQAGVIAHESLKEHIKPYGYAPEKINRGIWTHQYRYIKFTLVVDDFGIRYRNKKFAYHLISAPQARYEATKYWKGRLYCGITLHLYYKA